MTLALDSAGRRHHVVPATSISLTTAAADRVQSFLTRRGHGVGLRLAVKKTGCSGFAYVVNYADDICKLWQRPLVFRGSVSVRNSSHQSPCDSLLDYSSTAPRTGLLAKPGPQRGVSLSQSAKPKGERGFAARALTAVLRPASLTLRPYSIFLLTPGHAKAGLTRAQLLLAGDISLWAGLGKLFSNH